MSEYVAASEESLLADHLVARVIGRASGDIEDECLRNCPHDRYFVGNLRPMDEPDPGPGGDHGDAKRDSAGADGLETQYRSEFLSKLSPMAFGADFLVSPSNDTCVIEVTLEWDCYYRVFPTFEQQREYQLYAVADSVNADATSASSPTPSVPADGARNGTPVRHIAHPEDFCLRFRKVICSATGEVTLRLNADCWTASKSQLDRAIAEELQRAVGVALSDPDRYRVHASGSVPIRVPTESLESADTYGAYIGTLTHDVRPQWTWRVSVDVHAREDETAIMVGIQFANASPPDDARNTVEPFLFNVHSTFMPQSGQVVPFTLASAPKGFRYDRSVWGHGFNCSVVRDVESGALRTAHAPEFRQMRYLTRMTPVARFDELALDPMPVLEAILNDMKDYENRWEDYRRRYASQISDWERTYGSEFERDRQAYGSDICRFEEGLKLLRSDPDLLYAFRLTNMAFARGTHDRWRLFQVIFLVSQIPGMAALKAEHLAYMPEREVVDIIYFPTGGGKTEAYLAVIVFHCFFDRLRGKRCGVTAWTRFPLRFLTLQQTQRAVDAIGLAELVRLEQSDDRLSGPDVDGFAVGYFVGQAGSPNKIIPPSRYQPDGSPEWSHANDPVQRQQWKRVITCPACRTNSVMVGFDPDTVRVCHRCTNVGCPFPEGLLPLYIVDQEIYRYLPSLVVGTIDKLAALGNQRMLAHLLGAVNGCCPAHGYFVNACCFRDCKRSKEWHTDLPRVPTGATLFVQDELHLLKEELGTFNSHYESFVQRLRREFGHVDPLKIIGSSATIEAFERQVEHLYGRRGSLARCFPGLGPSDAESFYAHTQDYPQRLFVGVLPHNKTILNAVLEIIEYLHREVCLLESVGAGGANPYGGRLAPGTPEYRGLVDAYRTSLTYFSAKRELNAVNMDIAGAVNSSLQHDGLPAIAVRELTGASTTDDVASTLEHLERESNPDAPPDAVLATSMISHGVDIDRLNAMIFHGMPRLNAEYIQASSRVGRTHVGIIFVCFHPVRERDQSHYGFFTKYHEFLGRLVEPVAINRWSRFSIRRTLPGLFMAVLLQLLSNKQRENSPGKYTRLDFVQRLVAEHRIFPDDFVAFLRDAYLVDAIAGVGPSSFGSEIEPSVRRLLFDCICGAASGSQWVSDALTPKPMRSLRDVDEPIEITLDADGSEWARRRGGA